MEIVIRIDVPDGANVRVNQGQSQGQRGQRGQSQTQRPFTPRPDPEYPDWDPACPVHGGDWTLVPAGVSKTKVNEDGSPKRYNAFWACNERGCREMPERKPKDDAEGYVDELGF